MSGRRLGSLSPLRGPCPLGEKAPSPTPVPRPVSGRLTARQSPLSFDDDDEEEELAGLLNTASGV